MNRQNHSKNQDKDKQEADKVLVFSFDLQKTKQLPYLTINEVYYKRQLSVYNCGIRDWGYDKGYFQNVD